MNRGKTECTGEEAMRFVLEVRRKLQERGNGEEKEGKTPNMLVSFAEQGACFVMSDKENVELNWLKGDSVFNQYSGRKDAWSCR